MVFECSADIFDGFSLYRFGVDNLGRKAEAAHFQETSAVCDHDGGTAIRGRDCYCDCHGDVKNNRNHGIPLSAAVSSVSDLSCLSARREKQACFGLP